MTEKNTNFVDISYLQTGESSKTDALGMREMQGMVYKARNKQYLLVKAPPASGKSRALMFVALDKLEHQGIKRVIVSVPEMSIGGSFQNTELEKYGFFADWKVPSYFDLCDTRNGSNTDKANRFVEFFHQNSAKVLVCAHATLRNGMKNISDELMNDTLLAIDEFHHTSADANSELGDIVRRVMKNSNAHIVAMTGSYFRGDGFPVLRIEEEEKFYPITYNYYQQLNGYKYLKNLILGYHFYHGSYLDHISEVLDTTKKTIVHIPSVNSRAATGQGKYAETGEIIKSIGTEEGKDYNTGVIYVRTTDGRLLKVVDLVEDEIKSRNLAQNYLRTHKNKEDVDIIIALGTAKEGFDWQWCEVCLTIGTRGSLTEVIQIIGRCTRDCEGKETARFINMIAMPDADMPDVKLAVNDFMKAITASLLMEQVMAPNWKFKCIKDEDVDDQNNKFARTLVIEGLKPLTSAKAKQIVDEQLDDLKAAILQHDDVKKSLCGGVSPERINKVIIPKIIRERYNLDNDEVEQVRQYVVADMIARGNDLYDNEGKPIDVRYADVKSDDQKSDGDRFIKIVDKFIDLDKLTINLIDSINPFQRAYEIISKSVDAPTLKIIQNSLAEQKFDMTIEQAIAIFKGPLKEYVSNHNGKIPDIEDPNPKVRELAAAYLKLKNLKQRQLAGLEYEPEKE